LICSFPSAAPEARRGGEERVFPGGVVSGATRLRTLPEEGRSILGPRDQAGSESSAYCTFVNMSLILFIHDLFDLFTNLSRYAESVI
jgi:hypothetical protein